MQKSGSELAFSCLLALPGAAVRRFTRLVDLVVVFDIYRATYILDCWFAHLNELNQESKDSQTLLQQVV